MDSVVEIVVDKRIDCGIGRLGNNLCLLKCGCFCCCCCSGGGGEGEAKLSVMATWLL